MDAVREKGQADFDLERFIDMFDEALTSNDERVVNALRSLMMMVILTKPETRKDSAIGPLRQLYDDLHNLNRRMHGMEDALRQIEYRNRREEKVYSAKDYWGPTSFTMGAEEYDEKMRQAFLNINSPGKMK